LVNATESDLVISTDVTSSPLYSSPYGSPALTLTLSLEVPPGPLMVMETSVEIVKPTMTVLSGRGPSGKLNTRPPFETDTTVPSSSVRGLSGSSEMM
jgi:hypothetical protein